MRCIRTDVPLQPYCRTIADLPACVILIPVLGRPRVRPLTRMHRLWFTVPKNLLARGLSHGS